MGLGIIGDIFGGEKSKQGPANPWSRADLDAILGRLKDTSEYNYLKKDADPTNFNAWLGQLSTPSSVDAVRSDIEGQQLQDLLGQIDKDTAQAAGGVRTSALESGWGGAGLSSDIESVGLGRVMGEGAKAKSTARLGYATSALDRLSQREKAMQDALGTRYSTESANKNARDLTLANIMAGTESTTAQTLANLFNQGAANTIAGRTPRKPGILEDIARNTNISLMV